MHPRLAHLSTARPSSALRLGFTSPKPNVQETPSKISQVPPMSFTFGIAQQAAPSELSPVAKQMMKEIREKAASYKEQFVAERKVQGAVAIDLSARKIAQPRRKGGRFSDAHKAEFDKMPSIAGHASAWRAQEGRFTPVKASLKRSPSKANLDGTPTSTNSSLKRSPSKANIDDDRHSGATAGLKRPRYMAKLGNPPEFATRNIEPDALQNMTHVSTPQGPASAVKRVKKQDGDDVSSARPASRDACFIPRPTSSGKGGVSVSHSEASLARLARPTKSSLGHHVAEGKSTVSLVESPNSKIGGHAKPATAQSVRSPHSSPDMKRRFMGSGHLPNIRSILRRHKPSETSGQTGIPFATASFLARTPQPTKRANKELPPLPLTTPRRKLTAKSVTFSPDLLGAARNQDSPSMQKTRSVQRASVAMPVSPVHETKRKCGEIEYPDLSFQLESLMGQKNDAVSAVRKTTQPSIFHFRGDHTIERGLSSPRGFGAQSGQSSIRHVRGSIMPTVSMPGSYPPPPSPCTHPDKENTAPVPAQTLPGAPHGMTNKKRHRVSSDEEDAENEDAQRVAKKQKNEHVPEGDALLAPRLTGGTPARGPTKPEPPRSAGHPPARTPGRTLKGKLSGAAPRSASPGKKQRPKLTMSRLNTLARPKSRA